jgi:hypothetical protein
MQMMMGALLAGFPEASPKGNESQSVVHGLDDLNTFESEMTTAGFQDISFEPIVHGFPILATEALWKSMVKGSAPITLMKSMVDSKTWKEKGNKCIQYLRDN